jgi:hypothetical protein
VICYHTTDAADAIVSHGFRDGTWSLVPGEEGVFLSEQPVTDGEGATGDQLLRVEFGDDVDLSTYELPVGKPRQWFMPAAVIKEHAVVTLLTEDERDAAMDARWARVVPPANDDDDGGDGDGVAAEHPR